MQRFRTLLEQKIRERRETFEEFAEFAEVFAREHGETGTISVRNLQRLVAGRGTGGQPLGHVRPATARLLERIFGVSIDELLSPPAHSPVTPASGLHPSTTSISDTAGNWATVAEMDSGRAGLTTAGAHRASPVRRLDETRGVSYAESVGDLVGWVSDGTRQRVAERLEMWDLGEVRDRGFKLRGVSRSQLAYALADYYGGDAAPHRVYVVDVDGQRVATSVLTRPEWSELALPLGPDADRVVLADVEPDDVGRVIHVDDHAVERLAEAATLGVRMTNKPLYRLLNVDIRGGVISGSVGLVPFGDYALTMDLLEREISEALAAGRQVRPGDLPLRDRRLPDLASVLDLRSRLCAGGVVGLCAIARPADPYRGPADYALLVQERSGQVLNGAGRLAVIPKGFHEPLNDVRADARIGVTLRREMEEELFGRVEVDSTLPTSRAVAPMHPGRLSEPMRWLLDVPGRLRTECTGFGLNLVSGNYEFASLVVIEDEEFWPRFGGNIEANWESSGLQLYSSLDGDLISKLVLDESWSNEGLFAFLQGIRRLREIGGARAMLPEISSSR